MFQFGTSISQHILHYGTDFDISMKGKALDTIRDEEGDRDH